MQENSKSDLKSDLKTLFEQGLTVATDPINNTAIQTGGKAITTLTSYWLHQRCPVCSHTFRLGDEVEIAEDGIVRHDSVLLPCSQNRGENLGHFEEASAFFMGLDAACPPPGNIPIVRLDVGHHLLNPPLAGFKRHTCAVCSHTFRQNDRVVICPCSPHQPLCKIAVHRDLMHGLNCLEAWNPGLNGRLNQPIYCPVTSRKLYE
ncbi:hypothetical protein [Calothrix sp. PCC 6303]|uniref:hypothetical protein n=1 Tax=Calothrix sp. PCC 6303 TaxID=1170562 RepID=UPI0002A013D2|nr:hypothetical protein [Calothrix sp. PCC 6303]AFZ01307.1 hypothetical protein Cal6303_2291 [Calothrix sp. PCC 6303]